ncbi:chemotaxis protein [Streptococcus chenjunshii]|uniref:Chemotaxis protein n=1 Tax=Streptococcus chenjunshii TaxID=2173853 RepID=A0A372KMH5_9STRE|nr:chemotaxis protein [Streptococcus chenjunshii]AXQ79464.1 chemotaxis protein [Streptococcus chenjunshii]RFU51078.1 chemotaxis protein [Streptococcus chenjunshii]RFU53176.1 chemotaxis protein [Streptococcus chenjunshii]
MKVKNVLMLSLLAYTGYHAYANREIIKSSALSAKKSLLAAKTDWHNIQKSLERITQQTENLQAINQDLTYKGRVFNQELQAHLKQIAAVLDKYKS